MNAVHSGITDIHMKSRSTPLPLHRHTFRCRKDIYRVRRTWQCSNCMLAQLSQDGGLRLRRCKRGTLQNCSHCSFIDERIPSLWFVRRLATWDGCGLNIIIFSEESNNLPILKNITWSLYMTPFGKCAAISPKDNLAHGYTSNIARWPEVGLQLLQAGTQNPEKVPPWSLTLPLEVAAKHLWITGLGAIPPS